jgi:5-oxoprolinase (ATP-hydrolysing) subunit A
MNWVVDLNADLGEGMGGDNELLGLVSSASIACGFHAGDAHSMREAILAASRFGVAIGAHPSLYDRENFGRKEWPVTPDQVFDLMVYQVGVFQAIAEGAGARPNHVKPHGALYNMAARDRDVADAVARGVTAVNPSLFLFAPAGSALAGAAAARKLKVVPEVFADRNYLGNGSLVPRTRPDALLHDPAEAAGRVLRMLREGKVSSVEGVDVMVKAETICVHGDTPEAVEFARVLRSTLEREGVTIRAPGRG